MSGNSTNVKGQLFGFIPQDVISRFQSPAYEYRDSASQEVLHVLSMTNLSQIDIPGFLSFLRSYVTDSNYSVAKNCEEIVSSLISTLNPTTLSNDEKDNILHLLVQISVKQLSDSRRTVCQLGQNVFGKILGCFDQHLATNEIVRQCSTPTPKLFSEIFRCFTALLQQSILTPTVLLQFPYFFDTAIQDPHANVKQSAIWCVDYLQECYPQDARTLVNLLSRESTHALNKGAFTNPNTSSGAYRQDSIYIARPSNTAGATSKLKQTFNRTLPISRNQYHRPMLPSSGGKRDSFVFASLSRPVSSISNIPITNSSNSYPNESSPTFSSIYNDSGNDYNNYPTHHSNTAKSEAFGQADSDEEFSSTSDFTNMSTIPNNNNNNNNNNSNSNSNLSVSSKTKRLLKVEIIDNHKNDRVLPKITQIDSSSLDLSSDRSDSETLSSGHHAVKKKPRSTKLIQLSDLPEPKRAKSELDRQVTFDSDSNNYSNNNSNTSLNSNNNNSNNNNNNSNNNSSNYSEEMLGFHKVTGENTPIHSTGFYNLGDDVEFDTQIAPPRSIPRMTKPRTKTRPKVPNNPNQKLLTVSGTSTKRTTFASTLPAPIIQSPVEIQDKNASNKKRKGSFGDLLEKIRSTEWNDQNDAIQEFMNHSDEMEEQITGALRDLVPSLLECSASLRSALAKNALNLLLKWVEMPKINCENVADILAAGLLQLQTSSHHFIAELASQCFLKLLDNISPQRAVSIINKEYRRKHGLARAKVAEGIVRILPRLTDYGPILKPLAALANDATQEARKPAKDAIAEIARKTKNFSALVKTTLVKEDEQRSILDVAGV